jgi:hypothetical protein
MVSPPLIIGKYSSALVFWITRAGADHLGIQTCEEKLHGMSKIQENHNSKLKV